MGAPVSLTVVLKREFKQVSFVYTENLAESPLHLSSESCRSSTGVTRFRDGQGSCSFNSCIEKGISAGLISIYGEPGDIPSSSQHLKLQELY